MKLRLCVAACALALSGMALLTFSQYKTVTLVIDGERRDSGTFARTVGEALRWEGLSLGASDQLWPAEGAPLRDGDRIRVERAAQVQIVADGNVFNFWSVESLPANLLSQAGVRLFPGDLLLLDGQLIPTDQPLPQSAAYRLQVRRATAILLVAEGQGQRLVSTAATLVQALWEAGIVLHSADRLDPPAETPLIGLPITATLRRARPVMIRLRDGDFQHWTAALSVGEALAEAGLALQGADYSLPGAESPLPADGFVRLVRVRENVLLEQESLPYENASQALSDLPLDSTRLVQAGVPGLKVRRVRIRFEDGQEITRTVEAEWVAQPPQPEIMGYGSQIVMQTAETTDGPITYYRALRFWATSYAPKFVGGSTRTASGKTLRKGLVGVDTAYIPFGTLLYIPGYGFAEAADTGAIRGRWIDLGYSDDDYVAWHQWVTVYFLWPPGFVPLTIPPPSQY